jgi:hypothetical protein
VIKVVKHIVCDSCQHRSSGFDGYTDHEVRAVAKKAGWSLTVSDQGNRLDQCPLCTQDRLDSLTKTEPPF